MRDNQAKSLRTARAAHWTHGADLMSSLDRAALGLRLNAVSAAATAESKKYAGL